jgi:hypothetical protein
MALLLKPLLFALVQFLAVEGTFPKCRILPFQGGNNAVGVVGGSLPLRARYGEQVLGFVGHYCDWSCNVWIRVVIRLGETVPVVVACRWRVCGYAVLER